MLLTLPVNSISPDPENPRKLDDASDFFRKTLEDFSESIKTLGLIEPIIVKQIADNQYQIIAGEMRWRSHIHLGLETIDAVVKSYSEENELFVKLAENSARNDLSDRELWEAIKNIFSLSPGIAKSEVAKRIGRSPSFITRLELAFENPEYTSLIDKGLMAPSMVFQAESFRKEVGEDAWKQLVEKNESEQTTITSNVLKNAKNVFNGPFDHADIGNDTHTIDDSGNSSLITIDENYDLDEDDEFGDNDEDKDQEKEKSSNKSKSNDFLRLNIPLNKVREFGNLIGMKEHNDVDDQQYKEMVMDFIASQLERKRRPRKNKKQD